ncbi:hypothetical protein K7396_10775 [Streptomyces angustmyceticus]|uniref:Uncharacterized protein n=2 Tax=Streptomyces angustmyceticus TaxID=285578 RepID=A0A5J4LNJ2_9ACTN|nr:hypothetical protein K7396_10775 [Streptomyces angustmyceticus]GES32088.1 hypothetical protein San01_45750 [Streptomyces angustmyceticus]
MYRSELEIRIRHEELRREADRQRLAREAAGTAPSARRGARSGTDEPEGRVSTRGRWPRIRRATA